MQASESIHGFRQFLLDQLRSGRLHDGERLPAEREMAEQWGIGRTLIRRVLADLKDQGLITQIVGSGTYVSVEASKRLQNAAGQTSTMETSPSELMEARILLEPAIMDLVVRHATSADFTRMEECCWRAEAAATLDEFEHWDGALHQAIANATRNNFARSMFHLMNDVRERSDWGMLKQRSVTPERRAVYEREHRELVEALKNRDVTLARMLMQSHLTQVQRNMFGN